MKFLITALMLTLFGLLLNACSAQPDGEVATSQQLAHDFYVVGVPHSFRSRFDLSPAANSEVEGPSPVSRAACELSLKAALCETTAATNQITRNPLSVKCSSDSAKYLPALMEIYDETPEKMRLSLCTIEKVFISDNITSTAFASSLTNPFGEIVGAFVGFKKQSFVQQPSSHDLVTWKEQLAFGGSTDFLANDPKLIQIDYALKLSTLKKDGLFYVLMHELGHLVDFNNQVNSRFSPTIWSKMSWKTSNRALESEGFKFQNDFCFYECSSYLKPEQATEIYSSLQTSAFMTTYAGMSNYEDFAEFWVWHLILSEKSPQFTITIPGQATYDMMPVFTENSKIRAKLDFVEALWASPNLVLDNRPQSVSNSRQ